MEKHTHQTGAGVRTGIAGSALTRCRGGSALRELDKCKSAHGDASKNFTRVQDAAIRKIFRLKMENEAAKDNPQLSKKAHQAFKYDHCDRLSEQG